MLEDEIHETNIISTMFAYNIPIDAFNILDDLTNEQKHAIFSCYCAGCGSKDPYCQCWNDE